VLPVEQHVRWAPAQKAGVRASSLDCRPMLRADSRAHVLDRIPAVDADTRLAAAYYAGEEWALERMGVPFPARRRLMLDAITRRYVRRTRAILHGRRPHSSRLTACRSRRARVVRRTRRQARAPGRPRRGDDACELAASGGRVTTEVFP
jgi:hypothetical protein